MKRIVLSALAFLLIFLLCGCSSVEPTVSSLDDVDGKTVGVVSGTLSEEFIDKMDLDVTVKEYTTEDAASADLKNGTVDCIIIDESKVSSIVKIFSGLKTLSEEMGKVQLSFVCSRARADLASALSEKMKELAVVGDILKSFAKGKEYIYEPSQEKYDTVLTVGVCLAGSPYAYINDDDVLTGFEVEIAKAVCDSMGLGIEFKTVSRDEVLSMISTGELDFALGGLFHFSSSSDDLVSYSASYYSVNQMVITRK